MQSAYEMAVSRFRVNYLFRAVIDAGGNMSAAARVTGVHRNTMTRILGDAGYPSARIRQLLEHQKAVGKRYVQAEPLTTEAEMRRIA
jgi:DNA-binding phage protein